MGKSSLFQADVKQTVHVTHHINTSHEYTLMAKTYVVKFKAL